MVLVDENQKDIQIPGIRVFMPHFQEKVHVCLGRRMTGHLLENLERILQTQTLVIHGMFGNLGNLGNTFCGILQFQETNQPLLWGPSHSVVTTTSPHLANSHISYPPIATDLGIGRSKFCLKITATNIWPRAPVDLCLLHLRIFHQKVIAKMAWLQKLLGPPGAPPAHSLTG